ncbi:hypothetical protein [Pyrococcus kukulkanii]|uniref:HEPN domain-containing protein n=1 Tax=Pyrococcus kukulkanii TaxID=1609559 RepID=A0ABV4T4M4_9EURY
MSSGAERVKQVDPSEFISLLKKFVESKNYELDEVFIRRIISSLYFSLFIYWANRKYFLENKRSKGPKQDRFSFVEFVKDMISNSLDAEIKLLHTYRIASDHYALNPTIIKHEGSAREFFGIREEVRIDKTALRKAIESAEEILRVLKGL